MLWEKKRTINPSSAVAHRIIAGQILISIRDSEGPSDLESGYAEQFQRFLRPNVDRKPILLEANMRIIALAITIFLVSAVSAQAQSREVTISSIPASADEFIQMRDQLATTPEGGAAMLIVAMMGFSKSETLGMQFLTLALDQGNVGSGNAYKGYAPSSSIMYHVNRLNRQNVWWYTPFAYVAGATAENNYKVSAPYKIVTSRNKYSGDESSGRVKVFVNVHGFSPRPITLKKNDNGIWKAYECSSVFVNVPAPASASTSDPL